MLKLDLEKAEEPEIKFPRYAGSQKRQENSKKTSTSPSLTTLKHINCLLRNLYARQEATVRTGHGTMDWFKIGKLVCQGSILSPDLLNFYAEYIMQNSGWMTQKQESKLPR